jgi:WXG100 family type VII secretion target
MIMSMPTVVLVNPQRLENSAMIFGDNGREMGRLAAEIGSISDKLIKAWEGQASIAYRNRIAPLRESVASAHARIMKHSNNVREIAQGYRAAEASNIDAAERIAGNAVIF